MCSVVTLALTQIKLTKSDIVNINIITSYVIEQQLIYLKAQSWIIQNQSDNVRLNLTFFFFTPVNSCPTLGAAEIVSEKLVYFDDHVGLNIY